MSLSIPINESRTVLIDECELDTIRLFNWRILIDYRETHYAVAYSQGRTIRMHRLILNAPSNLCVDHINHNGLDNRRCNLRLCTRGENSRNRRPSLMKNNRLKGVLRHRAKWQAMIQVANRRLYLGTFSAAEEAALAYDEAARKHFGSFALCNFGGRNE